MQQRFLFEGAFPNAKCSVVIAIKQCCTEWTLDKIATVSRVIDPWKRSDKLAITDVDKAVAAIKGGERELLEHLLSEKDAELWEALQKLSLAEESSLVQELVVQEQSVEQLELCSQLTEQPKAPQVNLCCRDFTRLLQASTAEATAMRREVDEKDDQLKFLDGQLETSRSELVSQQTTSEKMIAEKDDVIREMRAEMEQIRARITELEKELKQGGPDFNQLVLQVANMREELALKDKQLQNTTYDLKEATAETLLLRDALGENYGQLAELRSENDELRTCCHYFHQELDDATKQFASLNSSAGSWQKREKTDDIVAHPVDDGHVSSVDPERIASDTPEPACDLIREVYAEREHQLMEDIHQLKKQLAEKNEAIENVTLQLQETGSIAQGLRLKLAEALEENRFLKAIPRMGASAMPEESVESEQDDEKGKRH
ncbi:hypothetical protein AAVH_16001 [Aphelenchoides avenae]|nr:hypothetical protein AAVH_16001 [Aphelenchus avenae]